MVFECTIDEKYSVWYYPSERCYLINDGKVINMVRQFTSVESAKEYVSKHLISST